VWETLARWLAANARRPKPLEIRVGLLTFGVLVFVAGLPLLYLWVGGIIDACWRLSYPALLEIAAGIPTLIFGFVLMAWSVAAQWRIGRGTPAPVAPPSQLVVTGPYELCRNPMLLGAGIYHLGVCTLLGSLTAGLLGASVTLVAGTFYHRLVEEKELELRFGEDYVAYKAETPYLCPRLPRSGRTSAPK
jgi:protein-S-isoprenylcysteine O-methyltransferase Ste14